MEKLRSKIFACFLALSLVLLTTPIGLSFDTEDKSIEIQSNKAHAVLPVAGAAAAFLAELAAASGLTVGEFVATVAGVTAVGTGMGIATNAGINYGNDASVNLGNLIDAADYPAWDTLSADEQESWGSKEYYDTAKFNSLLDAFGLGDARERFYSSGGGDIDYTENELARIEQLGDIGKNWINNGSNAVNDILASFSAGGQQYLRDAFTLNTAVIHGEDYSGWPVDAPTTVVLTYSDKIYSERITSSTNITYGIAQADRPVYFIPYVMEYTSGGNQYFNSLVFSKDSFNYSYATISKSPVNGQFPEPEISNLTMEPTQQTYNDKIYYEATANLGRKYENTTARFTSNGLLTSTQINALRNAIPLILYGEDLAVGNAPVDIIGYPEDISQDGDLNVYFPSTGIVPDTNWQDYQTKPETPPIIDEEVDLTEIIELLQRFHFTVDYNLLVQDNPLRSAVLEIVSTLGKFKFYNVTDELKVHDAGVYDALGHMYSLMEVQSDQLGRILDRLSAFFVTDTASDVIGDFEFPELEDRALDLVDTISTLAPFGAMLIVSEVVSILSQVGKIQKPELSFDFGFMPGYTYPLVLDLSWMDQMKPLINIVCITTLILGLMGVTARLVELEAAA